MIRLIAFIGGWIAFWMLVTFIGWFCNPDASFRLMAGNEAVANISMFVGWIPASYCAVFCKD